ncbi:MAG: fibronectin type III domain-containing protein, partial [Acidobacteriota bacterium]
MCKTKISVAIFSNPMRLLLLFVVLLAASCGRVGDPLPPVRHRALVPEQLRVIQRGDALILSWPKPSASAMQDSKVVRAEILRRDEAASEPARLPEERFLEEARVIGFISAKDISGTEARTLFYADRLPIEAVAGNDIRFRYAIRYVNLTGSPLPLSNYALLEPLTSIARPPSEPHIAITQDAIKLSWQAPTANIDDSQPPLVIGYNVYRRTKDQAFPDQPLNSTPITGTSFEDRKFKFGSEYIYLVRSVSQGKEST